MSRSLLINLLHAYTPVALEEQQFKLQMIALINAHEDCFERSLEIGHFTGSAWILNKGRTQALLLHHAKLDGWFQLGGHCDGDSDVLRVAVKEAQEESGIMAIEPLIGDIFDIDIHRVPELKGVPAHDHYDVRFLLHVTSDERPVKNHESHELRWVGKDPAELPTNNPAVVRMFNKWLAITP